MIGKFFYLKYFLIHDTTLYTGGCISSYLGQHVAKVVGSSASHKVRTGVSVAPAHLRYILIIIQISTKSVSLK